MRDTLRLHKRPSRIRRLVCSWPGACGQGRRDAVAVRLSHSFMRVPGFHGRLPLRPLGRAPVSMWAVPEIPGIYFQGVPLIES